MNLYIVLRSNVKYGVNVLLLKINVQKFALIPRVDHKAARLKINN